MHLHSTYLIANRTAQEPKFTFVHLPSDTESVGETEARLFSESTHSGSFEIEIKENLPVVKGLIASFGGDLPTLLQVKAGLWVEVCGSCARLRSAGRASTTASTGFESLPSMMKLGFKTVDMAP